MTGFCNLHSFVDTKPFHNMIALHQMDFYIVAKQNLIDILSRLLKIISCKANGITQVVAMTTKVTWSRLCINSSKYLSFGLMSKSSSMPVS
jgi:hypothetical protein